MTETTTQIKEALEAAKKIAIEASDHHNVKDLMLTHDLAVAIPDYIDRALSALSAAQPLEGEPQVRTSVAQVNNKWHAILSVGHQSFYLHALDGTEDEANEFARIVRDAFAAHWLRGGQPIAWTTKLALEVAESNAGTLFGTILAATRNVWGAQGVPLYTSPAGQQGIGVETIMEVVLDWCCPTKDAEDQLRSRLQSLLDRSEEQESDITTPTSTLPDRAPGASERTPGHG